MTDDAATDTSDMLAVHQAFRKAFGAAGELVGSVPAEDVFRRDLVGNFFDNVIRFLHVHHNGEEVLIWPKLSERCPDQAAAITQSLEQHQAVIGLMEAATNANNEWIASGSAEDQGAVVDAVTELDAELRPHLDDEQAVILPLCSRYITQPEWDQMPGHALGHFDGDKVWLILGLIRENMTQQQRDHMLANMPPPAVEMWTGMGESSFNALVDELRG
jgi:hemerythrin-like domain-containing protein